MLKQLAARMLYSNNNPSDLQQNLDQYYTCLLDIIDSKLYRPKTSNKNSIINFQNKAIEYIRLSQILNKPDVVAQLPRKLQKKESRRVITYKLTNTIRNKILNCKDTVNLINVKSKISFTLITDSCERGHSPFIDPHQKHITTGDLRIAGNSRLWILFTKGPNYREPRSTNFNKAIAEITSGLDNCIENLANKIQYNVNIFDQWKKMISEKLI